MTVAVKKSSILGIHEDHLRLNDPSCILSSNSTDFFRTIDLNTCGTHLEEDGDNLIFTNEITSFDKPHDVITRENQVKFEFSCVYPKKSNASLEFLVKKTPYVDSEKGFGKFTYQFELFNSSLFNWMVDLASYPVEFDLDEMIYMEITPTSPVLNTEMFVESCKATPSDNPDDPTHYSIIENGCKRDTTVEIYPSSRSQFRFGMKAFKFIGMHDQVYITCAVIQCEAGNPNTGCAQGCIDGTRRRRRETALPASSHYISQGPLRVRRTADRQAPPATPREEVRLAASANPEEGPACHQILKEAAAAVTTVEEVVAASQTSPHAVRVAKSARAPWNVSFGWLSRATTVMETPHSLPPYSSARASVY
ncbi:hypothetical protein UPYG_G00128900 [Umbra pygmaea]|uniref:ZP domain-containing protein n=1 Tax=Umbra pygmaea TaxID=75934 RepID=A0ABD0X9W6_UMBPY